MFIRPSGQRPFPSFLLIEISRGATGGSENRLRMLRAVIGVYSVARPALARPFPACSPQVGGGMVGEMGASLAPLEPRGG